jgi:FkbM family methyltransferase
LQRSRYASSEACDQSVAVNVTAFDGNRKFPETLSALIPEIWPQVAGKLTYHHTALLDRPGWVSFSQPETEAGAIDFSGNERSDLSVWGNTVDLYMKENGLAKLDVLKVDAEGFDDSVLRGAKQALKMSVLFVQFEANPLEVRALPSVSLAPRRRLHRHVSALRRAVGCIDTCYDAGGDDPLPRQSGLHLLARRLARLGVLRATDGVRSCVEHEFSTVFKGSTRFGFRYFRARV